MTIEPHVVLRDTAEAFEARRITWAQGSYVANCGTSRCALGGITWTVDPHDLDGDPRSVGAAGAVDALANYLVEEFGAEVAVDDDGDLDTTETVANWNDHPGRTVTEVVDALEAAAARVAP